MFSLYLRLCPLLVLVPAADVDVVERRRTTDVLHEARLGTAALLLDDECGRPGGAGAGDCALRLLEVNSTIEASAAASADAAAGTMLGCGLILCSKGSLCCMSRTVPALTLCCAGQDYCRFNHYDVESGVSQLNEEGIGSPRCFTCKRNEPCNNRQGGSLFYR